MNWRSIATILSIVLCGCVAKVEQPARTQPARAAARTNDPCSLLSEREATVALGQRVLRTVANAPTYCRFAAPANTTETMALSITFVVDSDLSSYANLIQRDDAAAIAGLGDRAVWNTNDDSVCVVKGSRRLFLTITDARKPSALSETDLQQKAVAAAHAIVERM